MLCAFPLAWCGRTAFGRVAPHGRASSAVPAVGRGCGKVRYAVVRQRLASSSAVSGQRGGVACVVGPRQQGSPSAGFSVSLHRSVGRSVSPCPKPSTSSTVHLVHRPPRPPSASSTVPEAVRQPSPSAHAGMGGISLGGLGSSHSRHEGVEISRFCGWTALVSRHAGGVKLGDILVVVIALSRHGWR